jgi:glycine betaine/proline transport system ATP-binding protein
MTQTMVSLRGIYKIFGPNDKELLHHVQNGMGKEELMEKYKHILALNNINIDIQAEKITVVMGLSGSGKSTLIRHLNRLIEPTEGEICLLGEDLTVLSEVDIRKTRQEMMSMVFQKFALLPHETVLKNVGMPLSVRGMDEADCDKEASKWIDRVGLKGYEDSYPWQLSGGMQQRVGVARALTANTPIMLMDEAFSALDPLIRTDIQDLLLELQKELQKTIIFITHDLDEALKLADYLVILKDGYVVQQGEPQHILMNPNDPYIEDFVSDINRARVLRVRSIMAPLGDGKLPLDAHGEVDVNDTLESMIEQSGGDTSHTYVVKDGGKTVGTLDMNELVRALVPRVASETTTRQS